MPIEATWMDLEITILSEVRKRKTTKKRERERERQTPYNTVYVKSKV